MSWDTSAPVTPSTRSRQSGTLPYSSTTGDPLPVLYSACPWRITRPADGSQVSVPPPCPVTGLPAVRCVQVVSSHVLDFIYRVSFGVRVDRQLAAAGRLRLWQSPCGLAFFDPMIAGDKTFYDDLYGRLSEAGPWQAARVERSDYARVAAAIKPGETVLDVGCGPAGFTRWVPQARYVGLERSVEARKVDADVRQETIAEHAAAHPGEYDVPPREPRASRLCHSCSQQESRVPARSRTSLTFGLTTPMRLRATTGGTPRVSWPRAAPATAEAIPV